MSFCLINRVSLQKPTLSTDEVGFSLIYLVYLRKPILSARTDKMGLSAHADKDCFPDRTTLSARADNIGFPDKPGLSERNPLYLREAHIILIR